MAEERFQEVFWRLIDNIIWTIDEEYRIMEEIVDNEENPVEINDNPNDVFEVLGNALEAVVGQMLQLEIAEIALMDDDEEVLELVYARNDRERDWRAALPRMQYLRSLEDPFFGPHFRMDRPTFERLIVVIGHHLVATGRLIRLRTEVDKCLLMVLWILANPDTFRSTGVQFGVSRGTVHFHYLVVIEALRELAPRYIKWPSRLERLRIAGDIEDRTGYPGITGMIDGTLIRTTAPQIQRERYVDRHQSYSMNVLAVCDSNLLYRHVYVGEPGSVHDTRVFLRSPLHDLFLEGQELLGEDEHLIGDGGYECTNKLLTPFRDLGNMNHRQSHFNYVHSSIRMCVERSFGLLKGKWRRLINLYIKRFVYCLDHIISCFVLHNFIILGGEDAEGIVVMQPERPVWARDQDNNRVDDEDDDEIWFHDDLNDRNAEHFGGEPEARNRNELQHHLLQQAKEAGANKREVIADILLRIENENNPQ